MATFDIEEKEGVWFDYPGGGRIKLRSPSIEDFVRISKIASINKPFLHEEKGKAPRVLNHEIPDQDKFARLLNDCSILDWEDFFDGNKNPIPCTIDTKTALMRMKDSSFRDFVNEKIGVLDQVQKAEEKESEKN